MTTLIRGGRIGNPEEDFKAGLDAQVQRAHDAGTTRAADKKIIDPVDLAGGWAEVIIDLSTLFRTDPSFLALPSVQEMRGYSLTYCRVGSTPGAALQVDFGGGGKMVTMLPGEQFIGYFKRATVTLSPSAVILQGTARLLMTRQPDVDYRMTPGGDVYQPTELSTLAAANVYNATAFGANAPTLATQGVNINGAKGVRFIVKKPTGTDTITAGSIRVWYYAGSVGAWVPSDSEFQLVTGGVGAATSGLSFNDVPYGRVYGELVGYTDSAGSVGPSLLTQVWGLGSP